MAGYSKITNTQIRATLLKVVKFLHTYFKHKTIVARNVGIMPDVLDLIRESNQRKQ